EPPDWTEILSHFRGSELQNYFTKILEDDLKALIKPQYVDQIPKAVKGTVGQLLDKKDELQNQEEICELPQLHISYKPQKISPRSQGLVRQLLHEKIRDAYIHPQPSAYLDSEQRLVAAKVIKRFILHAKKTGFVVEHDFIMATYLADRVIVFEGSPSVKTTAHTPQTLLAGMNRFLELLGITFRRDPNNFRPRINKLESVKDVEQKRAGQYFFLED
ncbi:hypothetical protein NQ318_022919, partial [Aromia moschata]